MSDSLPAVHPERAATSLLLRQRLHSLSIDVMRLRFSQNIRFDTMQNFCATTSVTMDMMQLQSPDGITLRRDKNGRTHYFVLYNQAIKNPRRLNFTLAHEIGHICLGHIADDTLQEKQANAFAAQLLAPRILVRQLVRDSISTVTPEELCDIFCISHEAARIRLETLYQGPPADKSDHLLLKKLGPLLPDKYGPILTV